MLTANIKHVPRDPVWLFILLGAAIFALYYALEDRRQPVINLSSVARSQLIDEYQSITGLKASDTIIKQLENDYITDEILFREALQSEIHLIDPTTRSSLIEKVRFRISAQVGAPTEAELIRYYADNMQRYYVDAAYSFEHVYFKKRPQNAAAISSELEAGKHITGDVFMHGSQFSGVSEEILRGAFGDRFLAEVISLEPHHWHGPITSNYGAHFVRMQRKTPARPVPFAHAKELLENDLMTLKVDEAVAAKIDSLKAQYEINIEP